MRILKTINATGLKTASLGALVSGVAASTSSTLPRSSGTTSQQRSKTSAAFSALKAS